MSSKSVDLVELYRTALAKAEEEGLLLAKDKEWLELVFRAMAAELAKYRRQARQAEEARQQAARQELKHVSRSRPAFRIARQAPAEPAKRMVARVSGTAALFVGFGGGDALEGRTAAKEPSRLARPA